MGDDRSMASSHMHAHADATNTYGAGGGGSDGEYSVLEDDSEGEDREMDYVDEEDDGSSSLSIPNESIDFDLVYSLHSFAATVEGQASVVKGDSLFLMDDTNSYWWLVRVLKTQDVGYIPAENIETPFERLARLNKHRNVDLAHATPQEIQEDVARVRINLSSRTGSHHSPSPTPGLPAGIHPRPGIKGVMFTPALSVHRYPPAVWNEEDEEEEDIEWDDGAYEEEDPELAEEVSIRTRQSQIQDDQESMSVGAMQMEPDDGMSWDDSVAEDIQARNAQKRREQQMLVTPDPLQPGPAQEKPILQQQQEIIIAQQRQQQQEQQMLAQQGLRPGSPSSSPTKAIDPAQVTETRKLTVTPSIARDERQPQAGTGPMLPSAVMQKQEEDRKRTRDELEALAEASKKKSKVKDKPSPINTVTPVSNQTTKPLQSGGAKLRKEHKDTTDDEGEKKKEKKKGGGGGVFGLFTRKKDKNKDKASLESTSSENVRESQESGRSSSLQHGPALDASLSPVTVTAMQQQQQSLRSPSTQQQQQQIAPQTPPTQTQAQVSQHASTLRQRDQQQQALYQQYLNRSPSSPPEAPSFGSASAVLGNSPYTSPSTTATSLGLGLPSSRPLFIRIFAGRNVETEATFKTVLLNTSTTSSDLIRQAIQRFRLPASEAEDAASYYLTIKQVEGSSAVKRSSVGSISSISSNLSMHPAIKQLSMNDFTDDSALSPSSAVGVTLERFSSPSFRFALQLIIYPEDLPEDMVFDPLTEAIVFKDTYGTERHLRQSISSGVSQTQRRKVFTFPKNVTVAEVIELGLERFGILEGVVEDKLTKRRSSTKVRYWLTTSTNGQERELSPSSRVVDAYPRPPTFRRVQEGKRRSIDSTMLLGNLEDISPTDPIFILRRSSLSSDQVTSPSDETPHKPRQLSRQEIIAAQRAASREKQRAILSTQTNAVRGVDLFLPGNAMIRSSRYDSGRHDGESIDVSDIIEQELRDTNGAPKHDLLEGIFGRNRDKDGVNEKLDRVLSKIKDERLHAQYAISKSASESSDALSSARSTSSQYSVDELAARSEGRTPTPLASGGFAGTGAKRTVSPVSDLGSRTPTPTAGEVRPTARARSNTPTSKSGHTHRQPSIASVMSDISTYATPTAQLVSPLEGSNALHDTMPRARAKRPYISRDDFGVSQMMAIIEISGTVLRPQEPSLHPVEEILFGKSIEVQSLHPDIREIYSGAFQQLDEMDKTLDEYLQYALTV
ncbi:hypothetical protein BU15DRAFT_90308 [Melanogaster broomeanus]|nr:hypothetical protein BU15DRAFT_90308 [Melanogaster broomeanus]